MCLGVRLQAPRDNAGQTENIGFPRQAHGKYNFRSEFDGLFTLPVKEKALSGLPWKALRVFGGSLGRSQAQKASKLNDFELFSMRIRSSRQPSPNRPRPA